MRCHHFVIWVYEPEIACSAKTRYTSIDGQDTSQPLPYDPKASIPEQVRQSIATSLKNLRTEYIDSVVLHSPLRTRQVSVSFLPLALSGHQLALGKAQHRVTAHRKLPLALGFHWLIITEHP